MIHLTLYALLLGFTNTIHASTWMDDVWSSVGELDHDENGKISHDEYATYWKKQYKLADINEDGEISKLEWRLVLEGKRMSNETTQTLDQNKDGYISKREVGLFSHYQMSTADVDNNGVLSAAEARALLETKLMGKQQKGNSEKDTKNISNFDQNSDNEISEDEFIEYWSTIYGAADLNKDGKVSRYEMRAMLESERMNYQPSM